VDSQARWARRVGWATDDNGTYVRGVLRGARGPPVRGLGVAGFCVCRPPPAGRLPRALKKLWEGPAAARLRAPTVFGPKETPSLIWDTFGTPQTLPLPSLAWLGNLASPSRAGPVDGADSLSAYESCLGSARRGRLPNRPACHHTAWPRLLNFGKTDRPAAGRVGHATLERAQLPPAPACISFPKVPGARPAPW
jgi:hypothetical protein